MKNNQTTVVNFTDFCKDKTLEEIKRALDFYNKSFVAEEIPEYFINWEISYDDSKYRNGKILKNKHSNGKWETSMIINDDFEYMFNDNDNCWSYVPNTFSEFISDILRYEDFDLLLSEKGRIAIYGQ
jgi:hypothetical protein